MSATYQRRVMKAVGNWVLGKLPYSGKIMCLSQGHNALLAVCEDFLIRSLSQRHRDLLSFLAHLSRRLIGELIVYPCSGVRPSVVRPSSTISKIFFSETAGPIVLILHIHHLQVGGKNNCVFCFDRIRTLVAMATYASHRLIMEKSENCQFLLSCWRYLNFVFAEMFIE